jgi:hypothetical protein
VSLATEVQKIFDTMGNRIYNKFAKSPQPFGAIFWLWTVAPPRKREYGGINNFHPPTVGGWCEKAVTL